MKMMWLMAFNPCGLTVAPVGPGVGVKPDGDAGATSYDISAFAEEGKPLQVPGPLIRVKVGTEVKPCYVDLTSSVSVATLCTMLHAAHAEHGPDVPVTLTELLPAPDQAWVPDAEGRRYFSELRLHIRDPRPPHHQGGTS